MASYKGHLSVSVALGAGYGALGMWGWGLDWGPAGLALGLTALGGVLPDLDSDSGVPVRELFGLAAAAAPFLLFGRLRADFTLEQTIVVVAGVYLLIRYGVSQVFNRLTVHRGMFHSIPAMLIAGLLFFLAYDHPSLPRRGYLAAGVMIGFLSHLVLDELCSVDFMGAKIKKSAGTGLKLYSSSWSATVACYMFLCGLVFAAWVCLDPRSSIRPIRSSIDGPAAVRPIIDDMKRHALVLVAWLALRGTVAAQQPAPVVEGVSAEKFRAHCERLLKAIKTFKVPLPAETVKELERLVAAEPKPPEQFVRAVQHLLDRHSLVRVVINPESRVKVGLGPGSAKLVRDRPSFALVKVQNEAGVTHPLRVQGPQVTRAGKGAPERWLDAEVYGGPPLNESLSGQPVEYVLLRLTAREAGLREATLRFDVGQGTQELGFRAEVPILFTVRAAKH